LTGLFVYAALVDQEFPLNDAFDVYQKMQGSENFGELVIRF